MAVIDGEWEMATPVGAGFVPDLDECFDICRKQELPKTCTELWRRAAAVSSLSGRAISVYSNLRASIWGHASVADGAMASRRSLQNRQFVPTSWRGPAVHVGAVACDVAPVVRPLWRSVIRVSPNITGCPLRLRLFTLGGKVVSNLPARKSQSQGRTRRSPQS